MTDTPNLTPAPEEIDAPTSAEHAGPAPAQAPKPTSGREDYDARLNMNMLLPGEPWLLVMGHDPSFAATARAYAADHYERGGHLENVESALQLADRGEAFQPKRMPNSVRAHDHERKQLRYQLRLRLRFTDLSGLVIPATDWLPIKTAPKAKEGEPLIPVLLAWTYGDGTQAAGEAFWDWKHPAGGGWWWANTGHGDYVSDTIEDSISGKITHWRPIPKPPALLAGEG